MNHREFMREAETWILRETLARHGGNVSAAARELGILRCHFYRRARAVGFVYREPKKRAVLPSREFSRFLGASL